MDISEEVNRIFIIGEFYEDTYPSVPCAPLVRIPQFGPNEQISLVGDLHMTHGFAMVSVDPQRDVL